MIVIGGGLLAISSASIFIKLCEAPALVIATYRMGIAAVFYIVISLFKRLPVLAAYTNTQRKFALFSGFFLAIHFITWISSLNFTSVASSVVIVQSAPIFVVIGSFLFLRERPTMMVIGGIVVTLMGGIFISIFDFSVDENSLLGNLLALGGAIGAAGYMLTGRKLRRNIDIVSYVTVVYTIAAILLLLITVSAGYSLFDYDLKNFLLLFAIAMIPQVIGHTSVNWALKYFSATTVSVIILGEPIGASILAWFILNESLGWAKLLGGGIILLGVLLVIKFEAGRESG